MCIICLKPAGVDMPSDKQIKHMFEKNPHGAGFALQGDIHNDGRFLVEYKKGFMNVDDLIEALGPKDKLKNLTVAIHCRIKTSGETDKFTTHPFPISNQYADLRKTEGSGPVLFHNGVFTSLGGLVDKNSSDTQDFVVGIASRYLKKAKMPSKLAQAIIGEVVGSCRVLILYPHRNFPLLRWGDWHEYKGCYFSNTGYLDEDKPEEDWREKYWGSASSYCRYNYSGSREYDEWGCNIAPYAWPRQDEDWIRFTPSRWQTLQGVMRDIEEDKEGTITCTFAVTGPQKWIVDEKKHQIYTEDRLPDVELREDEEDYLEGIGYTYDEDEYIQFGDEDELLYFCDSARKKGDYEYEFNGKLWYIDTVNMEAYTDKGIKALFPTGEQGHAKNAFKKEGFYQQHALPADFEFDDEFTELEEEAEEQKLLNGVS